MEPLGQSIRVVVLGDALASQSGDPKGIGWLGRVMARTAIEDPQVDVYPLPAPNQTSASLLERWSTEAQKRFSSDSINKLVVVLPNTDPAAGISTSRSRLNLANLLDDAKRYGISCFVIGPIPSRNPELNPEIEQLVTGFEDVCNRRGVAFADCFTPLVGHEGWNAEMQNNLSGLPGQVGHGLIAWLVLNRGWYSWLGVAENN